MFFAVLSSQSLLCNPFVPIRMEITISSSFLNDGYLIFLQKQRLEFLKVFRMRAAFFDGISEFLLLRLKHCGSWFQSICNDFFICLF